MLVHQKGPYRLGGGGAKGNVLPWLMHSKLFCGSDSSMYFSCNATSLGNNDYVHDGEIVATSLVHGGPGFGCLSPSLYQCIVEGPNNVLVNVSDVYDVKKLL